MLYAAFMLALLSPAISHRLRTNPLHAPKKEKNVFFFLLRKREGERGRKIILLLLYCQPRTPRQEGRQGGGRERQGAARRGEPREG
uniref:Secreted protein n=1 Tax=Oryza brachyantha TaxID=4533 RepID=J3L3V8_ORYBR